MKVDVIIPTYRRAEKLARCVASLLNAHDFLRIVILPDNRRVGMVTLINEELSRSDADIIISCSDDMEFFPETISHVIYAMEKNFPDTEGVIGLKQIEFDNEGTLFAFGQKFLQRFPNKWAFCPDYKALYFDTELYDFAISSGLFVFCHDALVHHYHPSAYPKEMDDTHKIGRVLSQNDSFVYEQRKAKGLLWGKNFDLIG